jgi:polar amino acid transport system substrate-binding protein
MDLRQFAEANLSEKKPRQNKRSFKVASLKCGLRCLLFSLLCSPVSTNAAEQIQLGSGEWLPFQSNQLKHGGVVSHVVLEAFKLQGIDVALKYFPWKRNYEMAKQGKLTGTFVWSKKPGREEHFLFSDVVMRDLPVLFYRKDNPINWEPETWASLKGLNVGATLGYSYLENFIEYETNGTFNVERVASDGLNFRKLFAKRIDVFPATLEAGYGLLQDIFTDTEVDQLTYVAQMRASYEPESYHLILSKAYPGAQDLMEKFNKGLLELKYSGEYDRFFERSRKGGYRKTTKPSRSAN